MSAKNKKFRSKWFRVALEGATTDGRVIEREQIEEMASTYNRDKYGARVWMEHIRSLVPDSPFRAYGDVLALKADEVTIDGVKRLALYAQIEPTDDLVRMVNVLKQKIFTSIEIASKFASTGKAYLMGLAVTDTPASLATEVLTFARQHPEANPLTGRKQSPENLFSAADEVTLEFEEVEDKPSAIDVLMSKLERLLKKSAPATADDQGEQVQLSAAIAAVAEHVQQQNERFTTMEQSAAEQRLQCQALSADLAALKTQLSATPATGQPSRPVIPGGNGNNATDC